jgi:hypothetical protein
LDNGGIVEVKLWSDMLAALQTELDKTLGLAWDFSPKKPAAVVKDTKL